MGLAGNLTPIWEEFYDQLIANQFKEEIYKKLIECTFGLHEGRIIPKDPSDIKNAFMVDETFLTEDLTMQKSCNKNFLDLAQKARENYKDL